MLLILDDETRRQHRATSEVVTCGQIVIDLSLDIHSRIQIRRPNSD